MNAEFVNVCPVCRSHEFRLFLTCQDHTVSQESFKLDQCQQCGFILTNPRPDETSIGAYYQSDAYISHSDTRAGLIARLYHAVRRIALKNKLRLINSLLPQKGTLLDIGCGTGLFASICQKDGWHVTGVEPDLTARRQAEANLSKPVYENIRKIQDPGPYQFITLWHVLEHIHRLDETLSWIASHLNQAGKLLIAVPNHNSDDAHQYGSHWAAFDVPRHLYHFTPETVSKLVANYGFTLNSVHPMPFDAYYVSLLSSKYKHGRVRYGEALWRGMASNWKASRTGQYSSLIYIFEKQPSPIP